METIYTKKFLSLKSARKHINYVYENIYRMNGLNFLNGVGIIKLSFVKGLKNIETNVDLKNDFGFFKIFKCKYYEVSIYAYRR